MLKCRCTSPNGAPISHPRSHQCPHPARIAGIQLINRLRHRPRTANNHMVVRNACQIGNCGSDEVAAIRCQIQPALSGITYQPSCVSILQGLGTRQGQCAHNQWLGAALYYSPNFYVSSHMPCMTFLGLNLTWNHFS